MKSTSELREEPEDAIAIASAAPRAVASPRVTRLLSLITLAALAAGLVAVAQGAYRAITDAWVAPTQLSPDSREVIALRMQASKDKDQRARLESELTSAAAEIVAIDLSLKRLRTLGENYSRAIRWNTSDRDGQLAALLEQKELLEQQRNLTVEPIDRYRAAVQRAKRDLAAGIITATDLESAEDDLARTQVTRNEKELEYLRVTAAIEATSREAASLAGVSGHAPAARKGGARLASPDVIRLDELRINTEVQIARLGSERRAAEARERLARASISGTDELLAQLESTPLFLAARHEIDLAFVPYAHLDGVQSGYAVVRCRWFLFGCREVGRIKRFFLGEVATDDPWGSAARGQYVELEMFERTAMAERTLRVRRSLGASDPVVAERLGP